jgi:hypothetical protein
MTAKDAEDANCRGAACRALPRTFMTFVSFVVSIPTGSLSLGFHLWETVGLKHLRLPLVHELMVFPTHC